MAGRVCKVDACEAPAKRRGWCPKHFWRWEKTGDPETPTWHDMTLAERFWTKVDKNGPVSGWRPELGPCWVWTRGKTGDGYGAFSIGDGEMDLAHRWSYANEVGPIPEGAELDHLCRNRACVRPDHLDPVSHDTNMKRSPIVPSTINAGKAFCDNGHEFTPENTRIKADGARECNECRRAITRRHHGRERAVQYVREMEAGERLAPDQLDQLRNCLESGQSITLREGAGLSRPTVAGDLGIATSALWRWEHGQKFPRPAAAVRYYKFLAELHRQQAA